jgi:hypothetical protein
VSFKTSAVMPMFADEVAVTATLTALFPHAVPTPLALDADRGWLALADFGDPIGGAAPTSARVDLVRDFARLPISAAGAGHIRSVDTTRHGRCADGQWSASHAVPCLSEYGLRGADRMSLDRGTRRGWAGQPCGRLCETAS